MSKINATRAIGAGSFVVCLVIYLGALCYQQTRPLVPPPPPVAYAAPDPAPLPNDGLIVVEKSMALVKDGDGIVRVTGLVSNHSGEARRTVTVQYNIYDGSGVLIGSAMDCTAHLGKNDIWEFNAVALIGEEARRAAKAKLMELSALQ